MEDECTRTFVNAIVPPESGFPFVQLIDCRIHRSSLSVLSPGTLEWIWFVRENVDACPGWFRENIAVRDARNSSQSLATAIAG